MKQSEEETRPNPARVIDQFKETQVNVIAQNLRITDDTVTGIGKQGNTV
jgi:hypothetical protein